MPKYQYGLRKFEIGDRDPSTGAVTNWREVKLYQNSVVIDRPESTRTNHFAQGDPNAKVVRYTTQPKTVTGIVFDRSTDSKVEWLGGTKTTVSTTEIATMGAVTGGTGYTNGSYSNIPLTGGAGTGATANITVAAGAVTAVTIVDPGSGYEVADELSTPAANLGGAGTGFTVAVATVTTKPKNSWHEPEDTTQIGISTKAFRLTYEDESIAIGNNMSVAARDSWNPNDTDVAGIPFVATVQSSGVPGVSAWVETDA